MIGRKLAQYEIIEQLGSGGMGDVYRARDTKLDRDVAVKVLPAEFSGDEERHARFMREAKAIAALKHPNIVTIYSIEEVDDIHFIIMELLEGGTLGEKIPEGGLPLERFFDYAIPLADAVSSAHDSGITHRDLKPANVMMDRDGRVKVLDFGLAKLLDKGTGPENDRTVVDSGDTAVGMVLGTVAYMSPEQAEGKPIDHRSDIFSLGILMYEMATGQRPFKGDTQLSTLSAILKDQPKHISEIKREVPRHVGRIVNHCLEKKPDSRYQSAKDVRNELVGLQKEIDSGELTAESESGVTASATVSVGVSKKWWPWAALAAVVVVIVAIFALRPGGESATVSVDPQPVSPQTSVTPPAPAVAVGQNDAEGPKMAVVLPFENLGPADEAYFADGMTEEITTRLSSVSGIGVISGTSARQYDRTGKTMKQIGEDLGVDYVLEGSVRWGRTTEGAGQVRITPRLIRVADDQQIWSHTYDETIDNIFDVQTDIATQMIEQLDVQLTGREQEIVENRPTDNLEAYTLYLQAEDFFRTGSFVNVSDRYLALMQRAVELDPEFTEAWAKISTFHMILYSNNIDQSDARVAMSRRALRKAEDLDPNNVQTLFARGSYYYYAFADYEAALKEFIKATEVAPSHALSRLQVGNIHRRLGNWEPMLENQLAAQKLDPQSANIAIQLAGSFAGLREYDKAFEQSSLVLELRSREASGYFALAIMSLYANGDVEAAVRWLDAGLELPQSASGQFGNLAWTRAMLLRDYATAAKVAGGEGSDLPFVIARDQHNAAIAEVMLNGRATAEPSLLAANKTIEELLDAEPDNPVVRRFLAVNLALLGREDSAIRNAQLAIEQTEKDIFFGPQAKETLAEVYAHLGRTDDAVDLLEELLNTVYNFGLTPHALEHSPRWDGLRGDDRFEALLRRES